MQLVRPLIFTLFLSEQLSTCRALCRLIPFFSFPHSCFVTMALVSPLHQNLIDSMSEESGRTRSARRIQMRGGGGACVHEKEKHSADGSCTTEWCWRITPWHSTSQWCRRDHQRTTLLNPTKKWRWRNAPFTRGDTREQRKQKEQQPQASVVERSRPEQAGPYVRNS